MALGKNTERVVFTLSKEMKQELQYYAEEQDRNVSNICQHLVHNFIKEKRKRNQKEHTSNDTKEPTKNKNKNNRR